MQRLYSPSRNISGGTIIIKDRKQVHHLKDVLRIKVKEEIVIFDEQGNEYTAVTEQISLQSLTLKIKEKHKFIPGGRMQITIACAIQKIPDG